MNRKRWPNLPESKESEIKRSRALENKSRGSNLWIGGISGRENRKNRGKAIIKEIIQDNFWEMKDKCWVCDVQPLPRCKAVTQNLLWPLQSFWRGNVNTSTQSVRKLRFGDIKGLAHSHTSDAGTCQLPLWPALRPPCPSLSRVSLQLENSSLPSPLTNPNEPSFWVLVFGVWHSQAWNKTVTPPRLPPCPISPSHLPKLF